MKITSGVTRIVFIFDRFVIKIPNFTCQWNHFLLGLLANINEDKAWKNAEFHFNGDVSHLLCPVIWYSWGGWVLVMEKAIVCDNNEEIDYKIWENNHFWDNKPSNFGYYKGRLVKIDYA